MHQKDIYKKLVVISIRFSPFLLICIFRISLQLFIIFEIRKKEVCSKSSTMRYMLNWNYAQYSKEETNLSGKIKSCNMYLSNLTFTYISHMLAKCKVWPCLDPNPSKPTVKIFIKQVGKY